MQDIAAAGKFLWPLPDKGLHRRAYRIKASDPHPLGRTGPHQSALVLQSDFQKRLIPRIAKPERCANAGHLVMLEQPDAFANAVTAFLNECRLNCDFHPVIPAFAGMTGT